jgi:hypothetical protein
MTDEVRREQHRAAPAQRGDVLLALDAHQAADALARAPPPDAALDDAAAEPAEVRARDALALGLCHLREALLEVDARHAPALGHQPEGEPADAVAERGEHAERQQMQRPEEEDADAGHAGTPLYLL